MHSKYCFFFSMNEAEMKKLIKCKINLQLQLHSIIELLYQKCYTTPENFPKCNFRTTLTEVSFVFVCMGVLVVHVYVCLCECLCATYWDPKWSKSMGAVCRRHFVRFRQLYTFSFLLLLL